MATLEKATKPYPKIAFREKQATTSLITRHARAES